MKRKETFIHYSQNDRIYRSKDFDSINRTGIEVARKHGNTEYIANNHVRFKTYKTLRGAEKFLEKQGYKPIAIEDGRNLIYLSSKAEMKAAKKTNKTR